MKWEKIDTFSGSGKTLYRQGGKKVKIWLSSFKIGGNIRYLFLKPMLPHPNLARPVAPPPPGMWITIHQNGVGHTGRRGHWRGVGDRGGACRNTWKGKKKRQARARKRFRWFRVRIWVPCTSGRHSTRWWRCSLCYTKHTYLLHK